MFCDQFLFLNLANTRAGCKCRWLKFYIQTLDLEEFYRLREKWRDFEIEYWTHHERIPDRLTSILNANSWAFRNLLLPGWEPRTCQVYHLTMVFKLKLQNEIEWKRKWNIELIQADSQKIHKSTFFNFFFLSGNCHRENQHKISTYACHDASICLIFSILFIPLGNCES